MADKKPEDGVYTFSPKFIDDSTWAEKKKKERQRKNKKIPKDSVEAFTRIDINMGLEHLKQKYGLTREEVLAEASRLIRDFNPLLLRP
jgi:hypothetical protein